MKMAAPMPSPPSSQRKLGSIVTFAPRSPRHQKRKSAIKLDPSLRWDDGTCCRNSLH